MAVSFTQATSGVRSTANSAAIDPVDVTTAAGDIVAISWAAGRPPTWTPAWTVDATPAPATATADNGGVEPTTAIHLITGLAAGSHTIDCTLPATGGSGSRYIAWAIVVISGADTSDLASADATAGGTLPAETLTWTATTIPDEGAALMYGALRQGAPIAGQSHTLLTTATLDGTTTQGMTSCALQQYTPTGADESEDMTITAGGVFSTHARTSLILTPAASGPAITAALDADTPATVVAVPLSAWTGATSGLPETTGTLDADTPAASVAVPATLWTGTVTVPLYEGSLDIQPDTDALTIEVPLTTWAGTVTAPGAGGTLGATTPIAVIAVPVVTWAGTASIPEGGGSLAAVLPAALITTPTITWTGGTTAPIYSGLLDTDTPHALVATPTITWAGVSAPPAATGILDTALPGTTIHTPTITTGTPPPTLTPPSRTLYITADHRTLTIDRQDRTITIGVP